MSEPIPPTPPAASGPPRPSAVASAPAVRSPDALPERTDVSDLHAPIMREKREPRDGFEPIPMWMVAFFGALLFWGGWYLATYNGGWRSDVLDESPAVLYAGAAAAAGPAKPVDPIALGKRLFMANCVSCHQADGKGLPGQYPPLAGSEWVNDPNPARIKRILLYGMEGPVTVSGGSFSGSMPNFGLKLKDEQLAAVLSFIRTNRDWGNNASPVSAESVAATRGATQGRVLPWRASELQAVTQDEQGAAPPAAAGQAATPAVSTAPSR